MPAQNPASLGFANIPKHARYMKKKFVHYYRGRYTSKIVVYVYIYGIPCTAYYIVDIRQCQP
jgi:hypothetical protein